jgi:hypothetical protein
MPGYWLAQALLKAAGRMPFDVDHLLWLIRPVPIYRWCGWVYKCRRHCSSRRVTARFSQFSPSVNVASQQPSAPLPA